MQRHLYEHLNLPGLSRFLIDILIRQTLRIVLNKKNIGFKHLNPKHHQSLVFKMVFRQNLLYFASLIMVMDRMYLDNDFQALFLSFYYCYCFCCCFVGVVVVSCFVILLLYYYIFLLNLFFILCGYIKCYFFKLLDIPIIYVLGLCIPFFVIFDVCIFSIVFFIALFWILFSYLFTASFIKFPCSIVVMTILL